MTTITLSQDILKSIASGYVAAQSVVEYLIKGYGFSKPSGTPIENVSLQMLMRDGQKIRKAHFNLEEGTMNLELA
jgi:hypothetical protein